MLDNYTVRINGYGADDRRTHVDIKVKETSVTLGVNGEWKTYIIPAIPHEDDIVRYGFISGLAAVTSYNYYNWVAKKRMTDKLT